MKKKDFILYSCNLKNIYVLLTAFLLMAFGVSQTTLSAQTEILQNRKIRPDSIYSQLDHFIRNKSMVFERKEQKIKILREEWRLNPSIFQNNLRLFEEYKSYLYDSAYVFANRSLEVAQQENNPTHIIEAKGAVMFCLLSAGLFKEASDIVLSMSLEGVDMEGKVAYYEQMARFHFDLADYNQNAPFYDYYIQQGCLYSDSLLSLLPLESSKAVYIRGQRQMKLCECDEAIRSFEKYLSLSDDAHEQAIALSCLGYLYKSKEDLERSVLYLVEAAINDIKGGVTETTALRALACLLYEEGDVARANQYITQALEDAVFYNARHRKIEIGSILPMIEETRYQQLEESRNMLRWLLIIIGCLLLLTCVAVAVIFLQIRKVRVARRVAVERNKQLEQANAKLDEMGSIKDEFIGMSFYLNSEYITRIENLYKTVARKVAVHQTDDLKNMFKEAELKQEREKMYRSFDSAFLRLFPTFIKEFESLAPSSSGERELTSLTPEMRIFALIRLGINEVDRIAKFLNYSVHTINTYKTRVKNRSTVPNDKFEARIMKINSVR